MSVTVVNPATEETIATLASATADDTDAAVVTDAATLPDAPDAFTAPDAPLGCVPGHYTLVRGITEVVFVIDRSGSMAFNLDGSMLPPRRWDVLRSALDVSLSDRAAGVIYVSMTEGRAKTVNLRRDPRAALEVTSADGWAWATAEGAVTLTGPGTDPRGPEVQALVDYYRSAAGEHPDWDEYRSVMVSDRRVLMKLTVERVYGEKLR